MDGSECVSAVEAAGESPSAAILESGPVFRKGDHNWALEAQ